MAYNLFCVQMAEAWKEVGACVHVNSTVTTRIAKNMEDNVPVYVNAPYIVTQRIDKETAQQEKFWQEQTLKTSAALQAGRSQPSSPGSRAGSSVCPSGFTSKTSVRGLQTCVMS